MDRQLGPEPASDHVRKRIRQQREGVHQRHAVYLRREGVCGDGAVAGKIKRSGENVAANEVEAVLRSLPGIEEAAVVPVPDPLRREEVKAYLKLKEGMTVTDLPPAVVLEHCRKHLAAFKVPRYLQYMEVDFPRTPSRKIAKKVLIQNMSDPFLNTYDAQDKQWR